MSNKSTVSQKEFANSRIKELHDAFGFEEKKYDKMMPLLLWYYRHLLRVETTGLENIPSFGPALLIGNHAGLSGLDGAMLAVALRKYHPAKRYIRSLHHIGTERKMVFGHFARQYGGSVLGHPRNAEYLLGKEELVLTYPEGGHSTKKPLRKRLDLCPENEFGTGFILLALRMGVPIIPIATVGVEKAVPTVFFSKALGRLYNIDGGQFPVSPQFLLTFGFPFLIMFMPLPVKCRINIGTPIDVRMLIDNEKPFEVALYEARSKFHRILQELVWNLASKNLKSVNEER